MTEPAPPNADSLIIIYTTLPTENDATDLARLLVEERLAACVNLVPNLTSIYRWQETIETAAETALFVKTTENKKASVLQFLSQRHPYTTPVILTLRPETVNQAYMECLLNSVRVD